MLKLDRLILSCVKVEHLGMALLFTQTDIVYWPTNKHPSCVSKNLSPRQISYIGSRTNTVAACPKTSHCQKIRASSCQNSIQPYQRKVLRMQNWQGRPITKGMVSN